MRYRLGIVVTHPIQYHAPWFRALAEHEQIDLLVIFGRQATPQQQAAAGFGVAFDWDVPLLEGYEYWFLEGPPSSLAPLLKKERLDAVLVNGWHSRLYWDAIRACWRERIPVMVRGDSHLHSPRHPLKAVLKKPVYRWFLRRMDACLAVGTWSQDYFRHYGVPAERIFIVPHVIDSERFRRQAEQEQPRRAEMRANWGLAPDSVVFLFSGKFIPKKRPLDFVRAIACAAGAGETKIEGLMVGDGPLRSACEQLVNETGSPVRFAGFLNQSRVVSSYVVSDALVLPSDGGETWGLVVNEAMTCGRPCIVSDHVGCGPDLIDDSTGRVFPLGDVAALADVLHSLDLKTLGVMREPARRRVAHKSSEAAAQSVVDAIHAVTS